MPYPRGWRKTRLAILARDRHRCQIAGPRCRGNATEVDHITPIAYGGNHHPNNLRAACVTCNRGRRPDRDPRRKTPAR